MYHRIRSSQKRVHLCAGIWSNHTLNILQTNESVLVLRQMGMLICGPMRLIGEPKRIVRCGRLVSCCNVMQEPEMQRHVCLLFSQRFVVHLAKTGRRPISVERAPRLNLARACLAQTACFWAYSRARRCITPTCSCTFSSLNCFEPLCIRFPVDADTLVVP